VELRQTFGPATSSRLDRRRRSGGREGASTVAWLARKALSAIFAVIASSDASIGFPFQGAVWRLVAPQTSKGGSAPGLRWRAALQDAESYLPHCPWLTTPGRPYGRSSSSRQGRRIGHECRITRRGLRLETCLTSSRILLTGELRPLSESSWYPPLKLKRGHNAANQQGDRRIDRPPLLVSSLTVGQFDRALLDHGYRAMSEKHLCAGSCQGPAHEREVLVNEDAEWNSSSPPGVMTVSGTSSVMPYGHELGC